MVCNIIEYINENLNREITINELSKILSYDKTYIMKRFKRELNITIKEYINIKKILNSLEHYNYNNKILNIAFKSGYNSLEYYSEIFTTLVGVSPRIYKKYILPVNNLTDDEINIIRINLTNLITIDIKIKKYITNQKPKELPVRKLSIFN